MRRLLACWLLLATLWPQGASHADTASISTKEVSQTLTAVEANSENINLTVIQDARPGATADAQAELYEGLEGNEVIEADGESLARIADGFAAATGIVSINQSPGNCNNQGNLVSFAYAEADGGTALLAGGSAEVLNRDNMLDATAMARTNLIKAGAFADFGGALQVNQSAGNLNNQNNILSVASGNQGIVAISETALGQQVARNTVREMSVLKRDVISAGAFSGASGIISVNQSSGCGNNQTNIVVISVQQFL